MAEMKDKRGGARPNTGGARVGAGRPRKSPEGVFGTVQEDPKAFLMALMNDAAADSRLRVEAAKALMPFLHQKIGEGGKKDERATAAKKAGTGKFAAASAPLKLISR